MCVNSVLNLAGHVHVAALIRMHLLLCAQASCHGFVIKMVWV